MIRLQNNIAVGISDSKVSVVSVYNTIKGNELAWHEQFSLPVRVDSVFNEGGSRLLEGLREVLQHSQLQESKPDNITIGISRSATIMHSVLLPPVGSKELASLMEFEIDKHLPFSKELVYYDTHITGKTSSATEVLFVAVMREMVDGILEVFNDFGFEVTSVNMLQAGLFNLVHNFIDKQVPSVVCILDGKEWEVIPIKDGVPVYVDVRSLEPGATNSGTLQSAKFAGSIVDELDKVLKLVYKPFPPNLEPRLFFCGNGAGEIFEFRDVMRVIQDEYGISTSLVPLEVESSGEVKPPSGDMFFCQTYGLAIKETSPSYLGFDLLPPKIRGRKRLQTAKLTIGLLGFIILLVFLNISGFFVKDYVIMSKIDRQISAMSSEISGVKEIEEKYIALKQKAVNFYDIKSAHISRLEVIKELTVLLPGDVWLKSLVLDKDALEIRGEASAASDLISILEGSKMFRDVEFSAPITRTRGNKDKFTVRMQLEE